MFRTLFKFAFGLVVIVVLAVGGWIALQYYAYRKSPEFGAEKFVKEWEKKYAEDQYGGDAPEETLRLFISALRQGDTDLAAKYFVVDKQQQWREDLAKIKEKNLLGEMIGDLENRKTNKIEDTTARYFLVNKQSEGSPLVLVQNSNGKWKIIEL